MCCLRFFCRCPKHTKPFLWPPTLAFGRTPHRPPPTFPLASPGFLWSPTNHDHEYQSNQYTQDLPPAPSLLPGTVKRKRPSISRPRRLRSRHPLHHVRFDPNSGMPPQNHTAAPAPVPASTPHFEPAFISWSPQNQQQQLNPALRADATHLGLSWDIRQFPSSAQSHRGTSPLAEILDAPAVYPFSTFLTLSFAHHGPWHAQWEAAWGPIYVRAQGTRPITVENVLDAVHVYFRIPLAPADRARVGWAAWASISDAFRTRLPRSPNLRAYDEQQGALRSDVLDRTTKFAGLLPMEAAAGWYNLMLSVA